MVSIVIIYHSVTDTTHQLAQAIEKGIQSMSGVEAILCRINGDDIYQGRFINTSLINTVSHADGVIFGSPTYMGSVSAQFKAFADASGEVWSKGLWTDKIAAAFTVGSNYAGDQLSTIQYLKTLASQHGMLWAGLDIPGGYEKNTPNRLGAQGGVIAQTRDGEIHKDDLLTAKHLGARVAGLLKKTAYKKSN